MAHLFEKNDPIVFRKNISKQFTEMFTDNVNLGENIEKGIYNYTIKEATNKQIIKKWQNPLFCEIYYSRLKSIYLNLKVIINGFHYFIITFSKCKTYKNYFKKY